MTEQERWRPVPGFPGYEVSDQGRVRRGERALTVSRRRDGRCSIGMRADDRWHSRLVHVVVAAAFLGPRPCDRNGDPMVINHRDLDPSNNRLDNLEYTSQARNCWHARAVKNGHAPSGTSALDVSPMARGHWPRKVIRLPPTAIQEAHDLTPTCNAARDAHWTAHSLACRSRRDLVNVQRKAAR